MGKACPNKDLVVLPGSRPERFGCQAESSPAVDELIENGNLTRVVSQRDDEYTTQRALGILLHGRYQKHLNTYANVDWDSPRTRSRVLIA